MKYGLPAGSQVRRTHAARATAATAAAPARHRHGSFRNGSIAVHDVETDLVVAARADARRAPCHKDLERRGERDEAA